MGQRLVYLDSIGFAKGGIAQTLFVNAPPNRNVAPPGPYVVFVMVDGIPAMGKFVQIA